MHTEKMEMTPYHDEYSDNLEGVLLEDHPLRSYPTECCPGLLLFLQEWYGNVKKTWGERVFKIVCILLMALVVVQFIAILPYGFTYLIPKTSYRQFHDHVNAGQWPAEFTSRDSPSACLSVNPRAHAGGIQQSIAAGCTGARVSAWLHNEKLLVGSSLAHLDERKNLQTQYLEPLLEKLDTRKDAFEENGMRTDGGLFENPTQSFTLLVEVKSSMQAVWPRLEKQLEPLRRKGYLSHLNGTKVINRPITVVITGRPSSEFELLNNEKHDIFFDASLDELVLNDTEAPFGHKKTTTSKTTPSVQPGFYSASANFMTSVGFPHRGRFSRQQIDLIRRQVMAAHSRGLQVRYEGIPQRKGSLRDRIWHVLAKEGADLIDVNWSGHRRGWWQFFSTETEIHVA